ncbi:MAG: hypothetical protein QM692_15065 [Thermomicrobiales bacterium]
MDTTLIDQLARRGALIASRRRALSGLAASVVALTGGLFLADDDAAARRQQSRRKKDRRKNKNKGKKKKKGRGTTAPPTTPPPAPPVNECAGKNWCVDRNQMCGDPFGSGKCLVEAGGGNICAEILFQAQFCTDCEEPACVGCRCVLAAGGGDRCNNGATGADFICVRPV